jgi:hypothetical protein
VKWAVVSGASVIFALLYGAAPASASTTWQNQSVPLPSHGSGGYLEGVSCPSKGSCTGVGSWFSHGTQYTLAERWDGKSWTVQATPTSTGAQAILDGVSCTSSTNCIAVGFHSPPVIAGEHLLVERWNGRSWTIQSVPEPTGATESELYAVSCGSATSCTAVGQSYPASGASSPLAEHWDGTTWTIQTVPFVEYATGLLGGVSCPTATDCVAVGSYGTLGQNTSLFAERWNGSRWASQTVPNPAGTSFLLNSVSCIRPEHCTAVGGAFNGTQYEASIVARANGSTWVLQKDATPAATMLFGVSCPTATACTAVGENTGFVAGVAEHWDGTSWALQHLPVPQPHTQGAEPFATSCPASLTCTTVGIYGDSGDRALADHES